MQTLYYPLNIFHLVGTEFFLSSLEMLLCLFLHGLQPVCLLLKQAWLL